MIDTAAGARHHPFVFFAMLAIIAGVIVAVAVAGGGSGRPTGIAGATTAASVPPWVRGIRHGAAGSVYAVEHSPVLVAQAREVCSAWRAGQTPRQVLYAAAAGYPDPNGRGASRDVRRFVRIVTAALCPTYAAGR